MPYELALSVFMVRFSMSSPSPPPIVCPYKSFAKVVSSASVGILFPWSAHAFIAPPQKSSSPVMQFCIPYFALFALQSAAVNAVGWNGVPKHIPPTSNEHELPPKLDTFILLKSLFCVFGFLNPSTSYNIAKQLVPVI